MDLAYHIVGDVKTIGDYEYLDLKKFDFRLKGEGIKSAYVAGDQIVEGRPALSEWYMLGPMYYAQLLLKKIKILRTLTSDKTTYTYANLQFGCWLIFTRPGYNDRSKRRYRKTSGFCLFPLSFDNGSLFI